MQSYSHLPLLGVNGSQSLSNSLHQLHLHNALLHSPALNQYATPTHQLAPPTYHQAPPTVPLLQVAAHQVPNLVGGQYWPSMEGLVMTAPPVATSTPSGVGALRVAAASPAVSAEDHTNPQIRVFPAPPSGGLQVPTPGRPVKQMGLSPADHYALKARSMEQLHLPVYSSATTPGRRSTSAVDLTAPPSSALPVAPSQRRARRQIHFAAHPEEQEPETPKATATSGRHRADVPTIAEGLPPYHHLLHTVPEEVFSDDDDDRDAGMGRTAGGLEWEYEDLELEESFRQRTGTV